MLLPCLWLLCDQWPTCFHLYEASGNLIPEALTSISLEIKQWGQQKNNHLQTENSKKRDSISVLEGLLSHLWTWDYQTMPRLKEMKGIWSFIERSISLSGSLHASLKQVPSLHPENLKCKLNLDWENVFITICAQLAAASVLRDASDGWCDTNKSIMKSCFKINQVPTAQKVCHYPSNLSVF